MLLISVLYFVHFFGINNVNMLFEIYFPVWSSTRNKTNPTKHISHYNYMVNESFLWHLDVKLLVYIGFCRYDSGVIVLKTMELWDGVKKFDGNNMLDYTNVRTSMLHWLRCWYMLFIYWFYFCLHQSVWCEWEYVVVK